MKKRKLPASLATLRLLSPGARYSKLNNRRSAETATSGRKVVYSNASAGRGGLCCHGNKVSRRLLSTPPPEVVLSFSTVLYRKLCAQNDIFLNYFHALPPRKHEFVMHKVKYCRERRKQSRRWGGKFTPAADRRSWTAAAVVAYFVFLLLCSECCNGNHLWMYERAIRIALALSDRRQLLKDRCPWHEILPVRGAGELHLQRTVWLCSSHPWPWGNFTKKLLLKCQWRHYCWLAGKILMSVGIACLVIINQESCSALIAALFSFILSHNPLNTPKMQILNHEEGFLYVMVGLEAPSVKLISALGF